MSVWRTERSRSGIAESVNLTVPLWNCSIDSDWDNSPSDSSGNKRPSASTALCLPLTFSLIVPGILSNSKPGLSSAFHLSRRFPKSQILLFEKQSRLGGWVKSQRVQVNLRDGQEASVLLEFGPRTLRPNANAVLELINLLNLRDELVITPKSSPAARNRFIFIPKEYQEVQGLSGLINLPNSLYGLYKSPLRNLILPVLLREPFKRWTGPSLSEDLSLHDLLSFRFSPDFARILGSSLTHGIYAGDSREISTESAFPSLYHLVQQGRGSISRGILAKSWLSFIESQKLFRNDETTSQTFELGGVDRLLEQKNTSVFSFKEGIEMLPSAMTKYLEQQSNVTILRDTDVSKLQLDNETQSFEIHSKELISASHVVSTVPTPTLHSLLPSHISLRTSPLLQNSEDLFSTVSVTNLIYHQEENDPPLHPDGFGFLVPRPSSSELHANPLGVLGVVFDSSSLSAQDSPSHGVCKLTVMSGGPYGTSPKDSDILDFLASALGPRLANPIHMTTNRLVNCIPHPRVGHASLVQALSPCDAEWAGGRLKIVGPGITGVSVGDCIEAGRNASLSIQ